MSYFSTKWTTAVIVWMFPFALILAVSAYYVQSLYLLHRKRNCGVICNGKVTKKWKKQRPGMEGRTNTTYYVQYSFVDCRAELTTNALDKVVRNHMMTACTAPFIQIHGATECDDRIIQIIIEFLGDSFTFYYGPFHHKTSCTKKAYHKHYRVGHRIPIIYEPQHIEHSETYRRTPKWKSFMLWGLPIIGIIVVLLAVLYGFWETIKVIGTNGLMEMILVLSAFSVVFTSIFMGCCCYKKSMGCFHRKTTNRLRVKRNHRRNHSDLPDLDSNDKNGDSSNSSRSRSAAYRVQITQLSTCLEEDEEDLGAMSAGYSPSESTQSHVPLTSIR